jgi:hypothetical protein
MKQARRFGYCSSSGNLDQQQMTTIILAKGKNLSLSDYNSNGDTIIFGNRPGDTVNVGAAFNDRITLGQWGWRPASPVYGLGSESGAIILGDGVGDAVFLQGGWC